MSETGKKSILIIGAGVAGLSTGCYGQMNGYDTKIFEMHSQPGGVCTTWNRMGYKMDGCIHWLTGTSPENPFYPIWEELGVLPGREIFYHDVYAHIEGKEGGVFTVYSDTDRLEQHMLELAPEDHKLIKEFTEGIRMAAGFPIPVGKARELYGPVDGLRVMMSMLPYVGFLAKWGRASIQDLADRFKNQFMREVFPHIFNLQNCPDFPVMPVLMTLAWMNQKTAGYPLGGSLELARTIEKRYQDLAGTVHYGSRVDKIIVENDQAVGLRLADGSEHYGDIIVSAADGHNTIFGMLEGKYLNKKIKERYDCLAVYPPLVYVTLGLARAFDDFPSSVTGTDFPLKGPIKVGEKERHRMGVEVYNFDPTLAPEGKSVLKVMYASDYAYWERLGQDPEAYKHEKQQISDQIKARLEERYPGLAEQVEAVDVATPLTWVRYTGNWKGSFQGWQESTKTLTMQMEKTLPGLGGFYMAGQWVEPGGSVPTSVMSGRNIIQIICSNEGKKFTTTVP